MPLVDGSRVTQTGGMQIIAWVQIAAAALLAVSVAESFRPRPWWPHSPGRPVSSGPARGTSPRERRSIHAGLALVLTANVVVGEVDGGSTIGWAGLAALVVGATLIVAGLVRGPSSDELEHFERRFADVDEGDAAPPDGV